MKIFKPQSPTASHKIIYLHIGVPKTASSTIQRGLFVNQENLERHGYLYPNRGLLETNHKNIFFELTSMPEHQPKFSPKAGNLNSLAKEIRKSNLNKFIISAEHFALFTSAQIQTLEKMLAPFITKVIVYLRRQDQVIQSGWTQNAKRLVTKKSLHQNITEELSTQESVYHYDYLLEKWSNAFGKDNIIPRIFERQKLSGHIFHDFLKTCGIEAIEDFKIPHSTNISPGYKTLGLIQEISKRLDFDRFDPITRVEIGKQVELYCDQLGWDQDKKFNAIDQKTFDLIMAHFQSGNQKVAREYFESDDLFTEPFSPKETTTFDIAQVDQEILLDILTHLLNTFQISIQNEQSTNLIQD